MSTDTPTLPTTFLCTLPDGHKLFVNSEGRPAIADESGHYPHTTDDGVLWLDTTRPLVAPKYPDTPYIPLTDAKGKATRTLTDAATLILLANKFSWPVAIKEDSNLRFTVAKKAA